jgi:Secretion system C-terminal sorting domain
MKKTILTALVAFNMLNASAQCWKSISANDISDFYLSAGVKSNGSLWTWGAYTDSIPTQVGIDTNWAIVDVLANEAYAIKTDGTMWYFTNLAGNVTPTQVGSLNDWKTTSGRLGLKTNNTLWDVYTNTQVGTATNWLKISNNASYIAIKADGTLWQEESTAYNPSNFNNNIQLGSDTDWKDAENNYAIKTNGTLWFLKFDATWPYSYNTAIQIGTATNWDKTSGGFALKTNGTLWSIYDTTTNTLNPIQIGTGANWQNLNANYEAFGLLIDNTNTLWAFGDNSFGNIGDGTYIPKPTPIQIGNACVATSLANTNTTYTITYPNPTTGIVTIVTPNSNETIHYQVINNLGQVIIENTSSNNTIDLATYYNGTYTLRIIRNTDVYTQLIVKQ